jgi:hypothetical protein
LSVYRRAYINGRLGEQGSISWLAVVLYDGVAKSYLHHCAISLDGFERPGDEVRLSNQNSEFHNGEK